MIKSTLNAILAGLALLALAMATASFGQLNAQAILDSNKLLGRWHSPGVGMCPTAKTASRPRMSPVTLEFSDLKSDGSIDGRWSIGCEGPSGNFDREKYLARFTEGKIIVELQFGGGARKYTYTITPADGAGNMLTPSGDSVATKFEHSSL